MSLVVVAIACVAAVFGAVMLRSVRHTDSEPLRRQPRAPVTSASTPVNCATAPAASIDQRATVVNVLGRSVGAQALGTTAYPIPPGAFFVSPHGSDGSPGTVTSPLLTVQRAVDAAPSGSTIVLRAGVYRQSADLPPAKALTLQSYPGEVAWFSGSAVVEGWVADGNGWRKDGWTTRFDHGGLDPALLIGADPLSGYPDMVFVDGKQLHQVAGRAEVVPGTFFLDEATSQLFIGDSPQGHTVEAAVLSEALNVQGAGSIVRGIGFMHYATSIGNAGAVRGWQDVHFENDLFISNAAAGLTLRGADTVRRVTSMYNGQLGIHGHVASGSVIEDTITSRNNVYRFNPEYAAGGIKLTASANVTLRGNVAEDNYGHGIWLDEHSDGAIAVDNITRRNDRGAGIMFELSDRAIIAGNVSTENEAGLQAGESSHVEVWNNTLVNNQYAFAAYDDSRPMQPVDITIRNNVLSAGHASTQVLVNHDMTFRRNWRDMAWSSDYNAFYRRCTSTVAEVSQLADGSAGSLTYDSVRRETSSTGQEHHSLATDNSPVDPYVSDAAHGDYRLPPGSPARGAGAPLPLAIAGALGRPAGVPVDIGAPVG